MNLYGQNVWQSSGAKWTQKAMPKQGGGASWDVDTATDYPGGGTPNQGGGQTYGGGQSVGLGGGAPAGPSPEQLEIQGLRETIAARRARATQIFQLLTGAVRDLAQEKRAGLERQFQEEQQRATEDFTDKGDELQRVYAARGLGDSSYRINAVDRAGRDYSRAVTDLGTQRQAGLAKVGQEATGALARIRADEQSLEAARLEGDEMGDIPSLRALRDKIDARIREAQVQRAQFGTESGFRGRLDKIAPYKGTGKALKNALSSLINSATPTVIKDRLANAIISNYAPGEEEEWRDFYEKESAKVESPTSVA